MWGERSLSYKVPKEGEVKEKQTKKWKGKQEYSCQGEAPKVRMKVYSMNLNSNSNSSMFRDTIYMHLLMKNFDFRYIYDHYTS